MSVCVCLLVCVFACVCAPALIINCSKVRGRKRKIYLYSDFSDKSHEVLTKVIELKQHTTTNQNPSTCSRSFYFTLNHEHNTWPKPFHLTEISVRLNESKMCLKHLWEKIQQALWLRASVHQDITETLILSSRPPAVIGRGGEQITRIQLESGCKIQIAAGETDWSRFHSSTCLWMLKQLIGLNGRFS